MVSFPLSPSDIGNGKGNIMRKERTLIHRLLCRLGFAVYLAMAALPTASAEDLRSPENPGVLEISRLIDEDVQWLNRAELALSDLKILNGRIYFLVNNVQNPRSRERLINERKTVRRLICELDDKKKKVAFRLESNRREFDLLTGALTGGDVLAIR